MEMTRVVQTRRDYEDMESCNAYAITPKGRLLLIYSHQPLPAIPPFLASSMAQAWDEARANALKAPGSEEAVFHNLLDSEQLRPCHLAKSQP